MKENDEGKMKEICFWKKEGKDKKMKRIQDRIGKFQREEIFEEYVVKMEIEQVKKVKEEEYIENEKDGVDDEGICKKKRVIRSVV